MKPKRKGGGYVEVRIPDCAALRREKGEGSVRCGWRWDYVKAEVGVSGQLVSVGPSVEAFFG